MRDSSLATRRLSLRNGCTPQVRPVAGVHLLLWPLGLWPVSQQRYTSTILTTTPKKDGSYIMEQAAKVDANGNPLLPQLLLGNPCDAVSYTHLTLPTTERV